MGGGNRFNDFDSRRHVFFGDTLDGKLIGQGEEIERQASHALLDHPLHDQFDELALRLKDVRERAIAASKTEIARSNNLRAEQHLTPISLDPDMIEHFLNGSSNAASELIWMVRKNSEAERLINQAIELSERENLLQKRYYNTHQAKIKQLSSARKKLLFTSAVLVTNPISGGLHYSIKHGKSGFSTDEYGFARGQVDLADIAQVIFIKGGKQIKKMTVAAAADTVDQLDALITG